MLRSRKEFEQQLLQSQVEVQESTYRHIAAELHDNIGQLLSTTKLLMGVTEIKFGSAPETLVTASATLGKAIQELRLLSRSFDKEWLEQFDFLENLQFEVNRINASATVKAEVTSCTTIEHNSDAQTILFRIVQETIQNALKHANPRYLHINIKDDGDNLQVMISNDGMPLPSTFQGMGTNNMRHRASLSIDKRLVRQPMLSLRYHLPLAGKPFS